MAGGRKGLSTDRKRSGAPKQRTFQRHLDACTTEASRTNRLYTFDVSGEGVRAVPVSLFSATTLQQVYCNTRTCVQLDEPAQALYAHASAATPIDRTRCLFGCSICNEQSQHHSQGAGDVVDAGVCRPACSVQMLGKLCRHAHATGAHSTERVSAATYLCFSVSFNPRPSVKAVTRPAQSARVNSCAQPTATFSGASSEGHNAQNSVQNAAVVASLQAVGAWQACCLRCLVRCWKPRSHAHAPSENARLAAALQARASSAYFKHLRLETGHGRRACQWHRRDAAHIWP